MWLSDAQSESIAVLGALDCWLLFIHYPEIGIALVAFGIFFQFLGMSHAVRLLLDMMLIDAQVSYYSLTALSLLWETSVSPWTTLVDSGTARLTYRFTMTFIDLVPFRTSSYYWLNEDFLFLLATWEVERNPLLLWRNVSLVIQDWLPMGRFSTNSRWGVGCHGKFADFFIYTEYSFLPNGQSLGSS